MVEHKRLPMTLDDYELDEVYAALGDDDEPKKWIRITIRGKNIIVGAYEPVVRIGDVEVLYPQVQPDEQTIVGFLRDLPEERAPIVLEYDGDVQATMDRRSSGEDLNPR